MTTRELLGEYTRVINDHGVNSEIAEQLIRENESNEEFVELAQLTLKLKKALTTPNCSPSNRETTT